MSLVAALPPLNGVPGSGATLPTLLPPRPLNSKPKPQRKRKQSGDPATPVTLVKVSARAQHIKKQSSRERGKFYRARHKSYQGQLDAQVARLHRQVEDLKLLAELQERLVASPQPVRSAVLLHLRDLLEPEIEFDSARSGAVSSSASTHESPLRFHLHAFTLRGSAESPVVVLHGALRGQLSHQLIHQLYFCMPGNTALLQRLIGRDVAYACTRTLFFAPDGQLQNQVLETDYLSGLASIAGSLDGLSRMLHELLRHAHTTEPPCL